MNRYQYVCEAISIFHKVDCLISLESREFFEGSMDIKDVKNIRLRTNENLKAPNKLIDDDSVVVTFQEGKLLVYTKIREKTFGSYNKGDIILIKHNQFFTKEQLLECVTHLYFLLYQQLFSGNLVGDYVFDNKSQPSLQPLSIANREVERQAFHHHIEHETKIMDAISKGSEDKLLQSIRSFPKQHAGVLSQDSLLRSVKNNIISLVAVATRAAIKGGIHYEVAYSLSDMYIQQLESIHNEKELIQYYENILVDLCRKVRMRYTTNYSRVIYNCLLYIQTHLYENISLDILARLVNQHPKYISFQFQKETGMSYSMYIQKLKIEAACELLLSSTMTISLIAERLNFYDQSHFSKTFKKWTGLTPKEFKMSNGNQFTISSNSKMSEIV